MANRLARERSPYLRQHADNPVDWYPWGDEAFEAARAADRPIFLSIGYATCHWCHVMAHESFEHHAVAALLNEHFVSIKVDREERPDIDRVYMAFVQATSGQGGWPMSVWLTPDLKPFYGGTYFPPDGRYGRPGFSDVLRELSRLWREERPRVLASGDAILSRLRAVTSHGTPDAARVAPLDMLVKGAEAFARTFDERHGGFGQAPKFPRPSELLFLLRMWSATGDEDFRTMVDRSLRAMALGGMRDHVGGGFHRYSVDREWRVPHFEKMLYDQAQLVVALLETAQATGDGFHRWIAEDTLDYVLRDMTHPEGGFYSAEDADSVPHALADDPGARATEGAFYLWRRDELETLLGADAAIVAARFDVRPGGNVAHDPHDEFGDGSILHVASDPADIARQTGRSEDDVVRAVSDARAVMLQARAARPRPLLDDKVLTAWNGLMIGAFARAARTLPAAHDADGLQARRYREAAARAARFVHTHLWDTDRQRLSRRWREGEAAIDAFAEDYAFLAWGLVELFQATGTVEWLTWARALMVTLDAQFADEAAGGWFSTSGADPSVLLRMHDDYDGAEPSATALGASVALVLAHLQPPASAVHLEKTLARVSSSDAVRVMPWLASVVSAYHAGTTQVVIVGRAGESDTLALHDVIAQRFLPTAVVVPVVPGAQQEHLATVLPWTASMTTVDGQAAAYVCHDFTCARPVTTPGDLHAVLDAGTRAASRPTGGES